ncbi:hypothetical protein [Geodermatophilus ruber]|uniref:Predicted metalloprotease n=1 Tax=Geodermatophilus ruber TaxID=504800 RepID=A0A1I4IB28_9ACTN|nr:hypothetical protein [Geodermatophilus ruber]SFL50961.1 Predicted metalloprotease [Geodermatophilus ruber]
MRQVQRRALAAAAAGSMLLAGCATTVTGTAAAAHPLTDVPAEALPITGAGDGAIDVLARNAMADLLTYWERTYPELYGEPFVPLEGGIFAVDADDLDPAVYPDTGIGCDRLPVDPSEVEGNAFYLLPCDLVAYDSALIEELAAAHGRFLGPAVMAHEMGHAIQGRNGTWDTVDTIVSETQADCFAGAWTRWVADGNAAHSSLRVPELDEVVVGFLELRDPVGTGTDEDGAHGSGFDRVSGFFAGWDGGATACRDEFDEDRLFTAAEFTDHGDLENEGNASYDETLLIVDASLPLFYESIFPSEFGTRFQVPALEAFDGTAPDCGELGAHGRDLGYCGADGTVYFDETDLIEPAYAELGDFAVATGIALPYALAARDQLGLSTDDGAATRSAVCLTGWYTADFFAGDFREVTSLSPGDVDEAVSFLLTYGQTESVLPDTGLSGFELVGAFRDGFLHGGGGCDVGL